MALQIHGGGSADRGDAGRSPGWWRLMGGARRAAPRPGDVEPVELLDGDPIPDGLGLDDEPPVDLSLLAGGRRGGAGLDDLVARIERAAAPELDRRARVATGVVDFMPVLARSLRPAIVAAAAALVLSIGLTSRARTAAESVELAAGATVIPRELVAGPLLSAADEGGPMPSDADLAWIAAGRAPEPEALAEAIGLELRP